MSKALITEASYSKDVFGFHEILLGNEKSFIRNLKDVSSDEVSSLVLTCNPNETGIVRTDMPYAPIFYEAYAQSACNLLLNLGLMSDDYDHIVIISQDSDFEIESLCRIGAKMLWDSTMVPLDKLPDGLPYDDIAMPVGEISPGGGSDGFSYTGKLPEDFGRKIMQALCTETKSSLIEGISEPFQWAVQHVGYPKWKNAWKETCMLSVSDLSFGNLDDSEYNFDDSYENCSLYYRFCDCLSDISLANSYPDGWKNLDFIKKCHAIEQIWKNELNKVMSSTTSWDSFVFSSMEKHPDPDSEEMRFPNLVKNIGRELGIDYAVESYFDGVPLEAIIEHEF